ncbi:MAG: T9SS type A sorting domain-containing protein [Bacteroidota bacterium]
MKNIIYLFFALILTTSVSKAQTTAMDFTMNDCNGQMHHLFSELDSGNVVILEFFMTSCGSCITAGQTLEAMYQDLIAQYGSKVRYYHFGFNNTYSCTTINNWVTSNGFSSVPFDSGAVQVAYYGGMGMPTIAVVAGNTHQVLFTAVGFSTSDTTTIGTATRNFFNSTGIEDKNSNISSFKIFPNPISTNLTVNIELREPGILKLELTNVVGQTVAELAEEKLQAGIWNKNFSVNHISDGFYFIKGQLNDKIFSQKITIHK